MNRYIIEVTRAAEKQLQHLDTHDRARVAKAMHALADNPRPPGCKALQGQPGYRIRVGDYRIVYTVHDDRLIVLVIAIGHRREVYR